MNRRAFLAATTAATLSLSGCVNTDALTEEEEDGSEEPGPVEVEVQMTQTGLESYSGTVRVVNKHTEEVKLDESVSYDISLDDEGEDGAQTGTSHGGGYFYEQLQRGDTYRVEVTIGDEDDNEYEYEWVIEDLLGLQVNTTPEDVTFEETQKTFDSDPLS